MSKFSKLGLRRAAGATALAAVAALGLGTMGTGSAAAAPLRDGYKSASGVDGEKLSTWRQHESQFSVKRVAYNGLGRTALVSGVYTSKASKDVGGKMYVYVIAGCQIDVSGVQVTSSGGLDIVGAITGATASNPLAGLPSAISLTGGVSLPITPGQAGVFKLADKKFAGGKTAAIQLSRFEIEFPNCGGYASARTYVKTIGAKGYDINQDDDTVTGEGSLIQTTLYGQPFFVS